MRTQILSVATLLLLTGCSSPAEEKATTKESCVEIAREFQAFFGSANGNFADDAQSLALGLTVVSSNAQPELAANLDTYIDLMLKVDSSVTTNEEFQALVEPKHVNARDAVFKACEAEGIRIN